LTQIGRVTLQKRPNYWTKMTVIWTFWRAGFDTRPVCVGSFGEGIIKKNAYRRVLQCSCTLHKKSCFLLRKNFLRKNVSHLWEMRNGDKRLVGKSERNKHLKDLAGTLQ
jgi:hypothetical protein